MFEISAKYLGELFQHLQLFFLLIVYNFYCFILALQMICFYPKLPFLLSDFVLKSILYWSMFGKAKSSSHLGLLKVSKLRHSYLNIVKLENCGKPVYV
jgi:hypothetical protein